mmetsp:Transcript_56611/g.143302  ORF Transcript_56611/g.143302 Transcript_56611/m.143302 type:complete len:2006 (+) Transcript_56611:83-6100(+)
MGGQRWKVVDEGSGRGVVVRHDKDLSSTVFPECLPYGAVVEETDRVGDCLSFRRLSGIGPLIGWVSVKDEGKELLVKIATPSKRKIDSTCYEEVDTVEWERRSEATCTSSPCTMPQEGLRWRVVRAEAGGLVQRTGRSLSSAELSERLPIGSVVEQKELVGDRLHCVYRSSAGPIAGWVSLQHCGRDMLVPEEKLKSWSEGSPRKEAHKDAESPLGGWAKLAAQYSRAPQSWVASAAETSAGGEDLPPIDDLEAAPAQTLVDVLGFPIEAAQEFVRMPRAHKRKIIAESKALIAMSHDKRQDALAQLRKSWPRGPTPTFASEDFGPDLLPEGCCFPLSLIVPSGGGAELPMRSDTCKAFRRPRYATPSAQKQALQELRCDIQCSAPPIAPEPGVRVPSVCRLEAAGISKEQLSGIVVAKGSLRPDDVVAYFNQELRSRVCLLDGDLAARFDKEHLSEADYRGDRFKNLRDCDSSGRPIMLRGRSDLLSLTKPNLVISIHKEYLLAGSDIIRTNTFEGNAIALGEHKMQKLAFEINKVAAQLAKRAAAEVTKQDKRKPRFVAGVLAPFCRQGDSWDALVSAYYEQVRGLVEGGVDILSIDAASDSRSAKAAIFAIGEYFQRATRRQLPLMIGACISEATACMPTGTTIPAFCISVKHANPLSLGLTCRCRPSAAMDLHKSLADWNPNWCHAFLGADGVTPDEFAVEVLEYGKEGLLNFLGGGHGTLPAHIAALSKRLCKENVRRLPSLPKNPCLQLSGLEACCVDQEGGCRLIGQKCTSMGSATFKRLIDGFKATSDKGNLDKAVEVSERQCDQAVDILDLNLDSHTDDGTPCAGKGIISKFVHLCVANRKVAQVPFMFCSCEWAVIKEGLQTAPGKSVVNGICLMLGEEEFLRIASECKHYGAAIIIMAIGEHGQAETYEDKVRLCQRSYRLLRSRLDFPPEDIIFDCQVLPLGSSENAGSTVNFMNAVAETKRTCPGVSFIGGVSNLSINFRESPEVRDALHTVFLHHAIPKGLNMALVEPGMLPTYSDLNAEVRQLCEEVILNRSVDGNHLQRFSAFVKFRSNQSTCLVAPLRPLGSAEVPNVSSGTTIEGKETQKGILAKRKAVSLDEQKTYWQSLGTSMSCKTMHLLPDEGASLPELCRVDGQSKGNDVVERILNKERVRTMDVCKYFNTEMRKRICRVAANTTGQFDFGNLSEIDFRGDLLADSTVPLRGNHALLSLTRPDLILNSYEACFSAGFDICCTNTLNGSSLCQEVYKTEHLVYRLNRAAAELAKQAAAKVTANSVEAPRFVAGLLGPTNSSLSFPPADADDPSMRNVIWEELVDSYIEQIRGLVDGGVDLFEIAMVKDTLNAKAAVYAIDKYFEGTGGDRLPLMISVQMADGHTTHSGQTLDAFLVSLRHARPWAVGIAGNLSTSELQTASRTLAASTSTWCYMCVSDPDLDVSSFCGHEGLVNLICCGSHDPRRDEFMKLTSGATIRALPQSERYAPMKLCGTDVFVVQPHVGLQMVGQRCNMTGSSLFQELINSYKYTRKGNRWDAAIDLCLQQCEAGADILDMNFDSDLVDVKWAMGKFVRLCATNPKIAKVPLMLSSSIWSVIEEGLRSAPGKCIVNAISLVPGEEDFLRLAKECLRYGAAVVVMAVENQDDIAGYHDKVRICQHCYKLLRSRLDFPAEDIIFDCTLSPIVVDNVSSDKPTDFMEAVGEIKRTCPGVSFIGGISNLSLPFRGVSLLRDALHSVFLQHAIRKGLNFAIADVGRLPRYTDLESHTLRLCEEVVLDSSSDGDHWRRLAEFARFLQGDVAEEVSPPELMSAEQNLPLAVLPESIKPSPSFRRPLETLVQATGTINASLFQTFGSKAHAANNFHRITMALGLKRNVLFSSISAYMGQGGSGPIPGSSSFLDGIALWERHQGLHGQPTSVQWGAIGEIGLRRAVYGSRDVFAQFDLGQKLIGPADTQILERAIMTGHQVPEFLGMAYLDSTWQNTLGGTEDSGGGLAGRSTFADV